MKVKNILRLFLACVVTAGCLVLPAEAHDADVVSLTDLPCKPLTVYETGALDGSGVSRASGFVNMTITSKNTKALNPDFPLEVGETVTINCAYSPASASMDFGLLSSDGKFYYINVTSGNINKTIQIPERGTYTMVVRNNSSYTVSVTGTVRY